MLLFISLLFSQIVDSNGVQYNSLQQAFSTATNKLTLQSKIVGLCQAASSNNLNIIGNGYSISCIDSGLIQFNAFINITSLSLQGFNLLALNGATLEISKSTITGSNKIQCSGNSNCHIHDTTITAADVAISLSNTNTAQFRNIIEDSSTTLITTHDQSTVSILNWSRSSCFGNLFDSQDTSNVNIQYLTISKHSCPPAGGNTALGTSRDSSQFSISNSIIKTVDGTSCSIGVLSITSNSQGSLLNSTFDTIKSRLFYLDVTSQLQIQKSSFSSVSEVPLSQFLVYQKGQSIIDIADTTFNGIIGTFSLTESSAIYSKNVKIINSQSIPTRNILFYLYDQSYLELDASSMSNTDTTIAPLFKLFKLSTSAELTILNSNLINLFCVSSCIDASMNAIVTLTSNSITNVHFGSSFISLTGPYNRVFNSFSNSFISVQGQYLFNVQNTKLNSTMDTISNSNLFSAFSSKDSASNIYLNSLSATNNVNATAIGTIAHVENGQLILINSNFNNNVGQMGGAIYVNNAKVVISNTKFNANQGDDGGSLYVSGTTTLTVTNSAITNGKATRGGAAFFNATNLNLSNGWTLKNNKGKQGNDQASDFSNFKMAVTKGRIVNITVNIADRFNQPFISESWDPIVLLTIANLTEFQFKGQLVNPIVNDSVVFQNIQISGTPGIKTLGLVLVDDLSTLKGKIVQSIGFEILPCASNEIEIVDQGFKKCEKKSCEQGCINGSCLGLNKCVCDPGYEGEDCTLTGDFDYLLISTNSDLTSLKARQQFVQNLKTWPALSKAEYRSNSLNNNTFNLKIVLGQYDKYLAFSDLVPISTAYTDKYISLQIQKITPIQRISDAFTANDPKATLFYFGCFLFFVIIFVYILVAINYKHHEFDNSPKWLYNNYFFAMILINISILLQGIPSTRINCIMGHLLWSIATIIISSSLLLHVLEWFYRFENIKACNRQFKPQNIKIYIGMTLATLFLILLQILFASILVPQVVISENALICVLNNGVRIESIVSAFIAVALLAVSSYYGYKARTLLEPKMLFISSVLLPVFCILYEITFTNPTINMLVKQVCGICTICTIFMFFIVKLYLIHHKTEAEPFSLQKQFKFTSLEKTSVKLTGILPIRRSNGFYKWEQSLIELVVPNRYLCVSEGNKMIMYKNFRFTSLDGRTNESNCFEIATNRKKFVCQCDSKEELDTWIAEALKLE